MSARSHHCSDEVFRPHRGVGAIINSFRVGTPISPSFLNVLPIIWIGSCSSFQEDRFNTEGADFIPKNKNLHFGM